MTLKELSGHPERVSEEDLKAMEEAKERRNRYLSRCSHLPKKNK